MTLSETQPYPEQTLQALAEAKRISRDETVPAYDNMADLKRALEEK